MSSISPYIIPPILCLVAGYFLATISVIWGKVRKEGITLGILCVWWTLLSYSFIYHNLETVPAKVMVVERIIHTLYVFVPVVSIAFFQIIIERVNKYVLLACFLISTILAVFVQTPYYFYGFYTYRWGMIARGGAAFLAFSAYGMVSFFYLIVIFIRRIRFEENHLIRIKLYYLFAACFISAVFTFTNIPAMLGIDFYPLSNFIFIPLILMTYGVLKYRLVRIVSVFQLFIFWSAFSSIIALPNYFIFTLIKNNFNRIDSVRLIIIFLIWYFANYYYFIKIQPLINQLFNRRNYNLSRMEKIFIKDLAMLKNLDDLVYQMTAMLKRTLYVEHASLYIRSGYTGGYLTSKGSFLNVEKKTEQVLLSGNFFEKSLIETGGDLNGSAEDILPLFNSADCEYIVPLVHQNELIAILVLKKKLNFESLKDREVEFICNLSYYATIALANSVMYQNLSDIKDNLEKLVEERTSVIEKQKYEMESDMHLARKIQLALLPADIPEIRKVKVAFRYEPIMGVGGDFIDIHYREGMDELGLFICDVSGHGASSAMIASMVKMSLNSWGKFIRSPGKAFAEIRELLSGKIGDNFITAYMCCIDLNSGTVTSACAGHPAMIVIRKNGDIELVKPAGIILFDLKYSEYEESRIMLNDGDKIVLYTDGVFEAKDSSGEMIGMERFLQMLKENYSVSADDLCQKIYNEIFSLSGNIIEDDFALLVAEYGN